LSEDMKGTHNEYRKNPKTNFMLSVKTIELNRRRMERWDENMRR